jgi:hypothetical protein
MQRRQRADLGHRRAQALVAARMVLVRFNATRVEVEILCATESWDRGVSDEVAPPLCAWLEMHVDMLKTAAIRH